MCIVLTHVFTASILVLKPARNWPDALLHSLLKCSVTRSTCVSENLSPGKIAPNPLLSSPIMQDAFQFSFLAGRHVGNCSAMHNLDDQPNALDIICCSAWRCLLMSSSLTVDTNVTKHDTSYRYATSNVPSLHSVYNKVLPLRNCVIRNSGLILLNKTPLYKKLSRLIYTQFLLRRYIAILYGFCISICLQTQQSELTSVQLLYTTRKIDQSIGPLNNMKSNFAFDSCICHPDHVGQKTRK